VNLDRAFWLCKIVTLVARVVAIFGNRNPMRSRAARVKVVPSNGVLSADGFVKHSVEWVSGRSFEVDGGASSF
jgi:hypothetical protein